MELRELMSVIHNLLPFWLLLFFGTIIAVLFNVGTVLACISLGVRFTKIAVFYGKPVLTLNTRFGPVCFGYIPTGGYIQLDMDAFPFQPRLKRTAVALSGPVTLLLSALLCLGLNHAAQSFPATYHQAFELLRAPVAKGKEFYKLFAAIATSHSITGYGILAAKAGMLNLLPLPTLAGGRLLVELCPNRDSNLLAKTLQYLGTIFALSVFVWFVILFIRRIF